MPTLLHSVAVMAKLLSSSCCSKYQHSHSRISWESSAYPYLHQAAVSVGVRSRSGTISASRSWAGVSCSSRNMTPGFQNSAYREIPLPLPVMTLCKGEGEKVMKTTGDRNKKVKRYHASTHSEDGVEYFDCLALLDPNQRTCLLYPSPIYCSTRPLQPPLLRQKLARVL